MTSPPCPPPRCGEGGYLFVCLWELRGCNLSPLPPSPKRGGGYLFVCLFVCFFVSFFLSCSPFPSREGGWGVRSFLGARALRLLAAKSRTEGNCGQDGSGSFSGEFCQGSDRSTEKAIGLEIFFDEVPEASHFFGVEAIVFRQG